MSRFLECQARRRLGYAVAPATATEIRNIYSKLPAQHVSAKGRWEPTYPSHSYLLEVSKGLPPFTNSTIGEGSPIVAKRLGFTCFSWESREPNEPPVTRRTRRSRSERRGATSAMQAWTFGRCLVVTCKSLSTCAGGWSLFSFVVVSFLGGWGWFVGWNLLGGSSYLLVPGSIGREGEME